jgi:hypothetical protein
MSATATVILALLLASAAAAAQPAPATVGRQVEGALEVSEEVEVFVMLHEPRLPRRVGRAVRHRAVTSARRAVLRSMPGKGFRIGTQPSLVSGFSAHVTRAGLAKLRSHPSVRRIDAMARGHAALAESVHLIGADAVQRRRHRGQNVTVAVLDTGVDTSHPDLSGRVVAEECFCRPACCPNGERRQSGPGSAFTSTVHGPHVTGILASQGLVAPVGVAPEVDIVAIKVLDERQLGLLVDWIDALDWIATNRPDVRLVNMSLVSAELHEGTCDDANSFTLAFAQLFDLLHPRGVATFAASGNVGQRRSIGVPACVEKAIAVAAVTKADRVWTGGNSSSALDLLAPGVSIASVGTAASSLSITGTSMAVPHAVGSAALLVALDPGLDANDIEHLLKQTGVPIEDPRNRRVVPRVDALAALRSWWHTVPPVLGGGARGKDCLAVWNVDAEPLPPSRSTGRVTCGDGDETCDLDAEEGQCTVAASICFNAEDRRLPTCEASPISAYRLVEPSLRDADANDAENAAVILSALHSLPSNGSATVCTDPFELVVPAGEQRVIRFAAFAEDGRHDHDRLNLNCSPAAPG